MIILKYGKDLHLGILKFPNHCLTGCGQPHLQRYRPFLLFFPSTICWHALLPPLKKSDVHHPFLPAICPPWQKPPLDQSSHQVRVPSACAFHCGPSNRTPWKYYFRLHHFILDSEYLLVSFYLACLLKYINDLTEYLCVPKSMPKTRRHWQIWTH